MPCRDNRVENNLFTFSNGQIRTYVNIGANTAADTFIFKNNLWYAHDAPGASQPSLPAAESDGVYGQDPALDGEHRIDGDSPAAGAGVAIPELDADRDGRCYASPPSIGAHEVP